MGDMGGRGAGFDDGSRAPRVRIPDPNNWGLQKLQGKDDGFHAWRESFESQVGSAWLGLDKLLKRLRESAYVTSQEQYEEAMRERVIAHRPQARTQQIGPLHSSSGSCMAL